MLMSPAWPRESGLLIAVAACGQRWGCALPLGQVLPPLYCWRWCRCLQLGLSPAGFGVLHTQPLLEMLLGFCIPAWNANAHLNVFMWFSLHSKPF